MSKFSINKDFASAKSPVSGQTHTMEVAKIGDDTYGIFVHIGPNVAECGVFTKEELRAIWQILTTEK